MTELKLEGGKTYLNGVNNTVKIVAVNDDGDVFFGFVSTDKHKHNPRSYAENGRRLGAMDNPRVHLVREATQKQKRWANLYQNDHGPLYGLLHATKEGAETCKSPNCIATVEIEI